MIARIATILAAAVVLSLPSAAFAATDVEVVDSQFQPSTVTIRAGETVRWFQTGNLPHNVVATDGSFSSGTMNDGDDYSHTFDEAGTYRYYCSLHGTAQGTGMAGRVVVRGAIASPGDDVDVDDAPLARTGSPDGRLPLLALMLIAAGSWLIDLERIRSARHRARA